MSGLVDSMGLKNSLISLVICLLSAGQVFSQADVKIRKLGKNESVSRSGQVLVRSPDNKQRAAMVSFAERVSLELSNILNDTKRPWVYPIEIETRGSLADVGVMGRTMATRIDLMEGDHLVLRLFVKLSDEFSRQRFSREILRLLLLERMLRDLKGKGGEQFAGKRLEVPHWILAGVDGMIDYRRLGRPSDLYAGIVRSRQLLTVEEILEGNPDELDSLSRASYEASAAALLAALFDQADGAKSFGDLLSKLILFDGDAHLLLKEQFPGLRGGAHSVDKWWALQVASMGELQAMEYIGVEETEARLVEALQVNFPQGELEDEAKKAGFWKKINPFGKNKEQRFSSGRIHDFEQFYKHKDYKKVLERSQLTLRALRYRCFPLYASVIANYEVAVSRLLDGKRKHVAEDLLEIDKEREKIVVSMQRVVDYLNYYEATQLQEPRADFEKYHQTRERLLQEKPAARSDRISKYLDEIELEYSGGMRR